MKLAEALQHRAHLAGEVQRLQQTVLGYVWHKVGEEPEESVKDLLEEVAAKRAEQTKLILDINLTNTASGMTKLISQRDGLKAKKQFTEMLLQHAQTNSEGRYSSGKEKWARSEAVSVVAVREELKQVTAELNALTIKIQELNWSTELIVS